MQRCIDVEKTCAKACVKRLPNLRARWLLSITGSLRGMRPAPPGVGQWQVFGPPCVIDPLDIREIVLRGPIGMEEIFSSGKVSEVPPSNPSRGRKIASGQEKCLRAFQKSWGNITTRSPRCPVADGSHHFLSQPFPREQIFVSTKILPPTST